MSNPGNDKLPSGVLGILGVGRMGSALVDGWRSAGLPAERILAHDPDSRALERCDATRQRTSSGVFGAETIVLAVKPWGILDAIREIMGGCPAEELAGKVIVSVAAGVTLGSMRRAAGEAPVRLVRAMPNTPAAVGAGMTTLVAEEGLPPDRLAEVVSLFRCVGAVEVLASEAWMHAATAVAGSGPAYLFVLAEAMADAGVAEGLPRPLARRLAAETIRGAGELLASRGVEQTPAELKDAVASPGGTTIEGVLALEAGGFRAAVAEAVRSAAERSRAMEEE